MDNAYYGLLALGGVFAFFSFAIAVVAYVLTAIGLSKLAQKQNIPNAWLAWVPIAQLYIIGILVKEVKLGTFTIPRMDLVLPLGAVAVGILAAIPFLGGLVALAFAVLFIYTLYLLFNLYVPDSAVLYTILSAIGLFAIFIFIIRDKDQVVQETPPSDSPPSETPPAE